jgi:hypothetical protein
MGLSRCENNATCFNTVGEYECLCRLGYTGPLCTAGKHLFYSTDTSNIYISISNSTAVVQYCHIISYFNIKYMIFV